MKNNADAIIFHTTICFGAKANSHYGRREIACANFSSPPHDKSLRNGDYYKRKGVKMNIVQVALIGITGMLIALQFRETKKEYAVFIMLVASILVFSFGLSKLGQIFKTIEIIQDRLKISSQYIGVLLKIVGIAFICEFSSDICKDSGFGTVANQIQIFGKLSIMVVSLPVFLNLIDLIICIV